MDRIKQVAARFKNDVSGHSLEVKHDDGLYRHLCFARKESSCFYFDIVTWPGFLAFTGDIGDFVFARVPDMLGFFRGEGINPGYWAEKCLAADRNQGVEEYSPERFTENVWSSLREWLELDGGEPIPEAIWDAVERDVVQAAEDGNEVAVTAAMRFQLDGKFPFSDFWEHGNRDYTHRFLWCCHALPWAIAKYDAARAGAAAPGEAKL